jgi:hypothetical protein
MLLRLITRCVAAFFLFFLCLMTPYQFSAQALPTSLSEGRSFLLPYFIRNFVLSYFGVTTQSPSVQVLRNNVVPSFVNRRGNPFTPILSSTRLAVPQTYHRAFFIQVSDSFTDSPSPMSNLPHLWK